jgi:putative PIN family toxin of toxin-antitoxin system
VSLRALCDTNVLVSAFIAGGPPSGVIEQAIDGRIELVVADPVLAELERVLTGKLSLRERTSAIREFLLDLAAISVGPPSEFLKDVTGDPDDDVILACAVAARADVLVSGDRRHLLPLGAYRDIRIITPQALLAELVAR